MIVLDTNVISALMLNVGDAKVVTWLNAQARESLWLTTIAIFELRYGIESLAAGRRRRELERGLDTVLDAGFQNRVFDFDIDAAVAAASMAAARRRSGHPSEIRDTMIAGIVRARGADFATRNVRHFSGLGINLINPWTDY